MDSLNPSLFDATSPETQAALAASLAPPASPGHFDELRGRATPPLVQRAAPASAPAPLLRDAAAPDTAADAADDEVDAGEQPALVPAWAHFFEELGPGGIADLPRRAISLARQIRDNGVTYNVYADRDGPQRPWSLDLFPLIVSPGTAGRPSRPTAPPPR